MAASVRVEDDAFSDLRYEHLGALLGTSKFDALGRMIYLWRQCTSANAYAMPPALVGTIVNVSALIESGLGEEQEDGLIRIKGTAGRIEWLEKKRKAAKKGAEARWGNAKRIPTASQPHASGNATGECSEVKMGCPPAPAPAPAPTKEDNTLAHRPDEHVSKFDFAAVYEIYPRKVGKTRGLSLCRSKVKTEARYDTILAAAEEMRRLWQHAPKDKRGFCPQFDTWVSKGRWLDDQQIGPDGEARAPGRLTAGQQLDLANGSTL